jgi:DNA-binding HxlR family transcriptional regulator
MTTPRKQEGTLLIPGHKAVPGPATKRASTHEPSECRAISAVLSRVGDKWTVLVVETLGSGPKRFNELRRALGSISQRMLTLTLRALERDGLVLRTVTPSVPPRVDYELTKLGHSLLVPVNSLADWARANTAAMEKARAKFDTTQGATS